MTIHENSRRVARRAQAFYNSIMIISPIDGSAAKGKKFAWLLQIVKNIDELDSVWLQCDLLES